MNLFERYLDPLLRLLARLAISASIGLGLAAALTPLGHPSWLVPAAWTSLGVTLIVSLALGLGWLRIAHRVLKP